MTITIILINLSRSTTGHDHLPVHVHAVPGVGELDGGVGLEHLAEENALEDDPQVDATQGGRDAVRRQLEAQRGLVAVGPARKHSSWVWFVDVELRGFGRSVFGIILLIKWLKDDRYCIRS